MQRNARIGTPCGCKRCGDCYNDMSASGRRAGRPRPWLARHYRRNHSLPRLTKAQNCRLSPPPAESSCSSPIVCDSMKACWHFAEICRKSATCTRPALNAGPSCPTGGLDAITVNPIPPGPRREASSWTSLMKSTTQPGCSATSGRCSAKRQSAADWASSQRKWPKGYCPQPLASRYRLPSTI